jgi:hypothetical protein
MTPYMSLALSLIATIVVATGPVLAESGDEQDCIYLSYIGRTPVIDNKTILVEMRGNTYKRIDLLNRCGGLKLQGGFSYSTSINKLCKHDPLIVLGAGNACLIDKIVDITEEEARALKERS